MTQKPEITDLTICRAAFAAWVFVYHVDLYLNFSAWLGPFAGLIRHGYLGVDGFFLLSGLVLGYAHPELAQRRGDYRQGALNPSVLLPGLGTLLRFYGKRLARIYPVHLATLLILVGLLAGGAALGLPVRDPARFGLPAFVQNLLLVQGWGWEPHGAWNYPAWSISTEWAGYLLFPFLAALLAWGEPIMAVQVVIVLFPVLGMIFLTNGYSFNMPFTAGLARFFPEFIAGMAMVRFADLPADTLLARQIFQRGGAGLLLVSVLLRCDLTAVAGLWMLLFGLLMQADAQARPLFGGALALRFLGRLSYAFYMSFAIGELLTVQWFRHAGWAPKAHGLLFAGSMTCCTFLLALLLHIFIERPVRRLADRWLAAPLPDAAPAPAMETPQSLFKGS